MKNTRRDLMLMGGGAAAGLLLTPVPWKLLDDISIWSQNWPWLPTPARGEITSRYSACTLCHAGCAVEAKCVGGRPFSLAPVPGDPVSRGVLCALGFGAHQMPFDALRLRSALLRGREAPVDEVIAGAAKALAIAHSEGRTVAVLDHRPGRLISLVYRRLLANFPDGRYLVPPLPERGTPDCVARLTGGRPGQYGYDFENARTILSVGSPLLDGWGTPGRMIRLWSGRGASGIRLLHAEPRLSRTAALADRWLPLHPGSETAFVLGLISVLVQEKKIAAALPNDFSLEEAARLTGLPAEDIVQTARALAEHRPSVIVGGGDPVSGPLPAETEQAIAALNLALGNVGTRGGLIERIVSPGPPEGRVVPETALVEVPPASIDVLLIDSATSGCTIAGAVLKSRLAPKATVIRFASYGTPRALAADFTIPVAALFESIDDVPSPPDEVSASWGLVMPLYPKPAGVVAPDEAVSRMAAAAGLPSPGTLDELLHQKAAAIAEARRGRVFAFAKAAWEPSGDAGGLWKKLEAGAVWVDDEARQGKPVNAAMPDLTLTPSAADPSWPLLAAPVGWRGSAGPLPPLATKLTRESHLRPPGGEVLLNPRTAREAGVAGGETAIVETPSGSAAVTAHVDPGVPDGLVEVAVEGRNAEAALALFAAPGDAGWRLSQARLRRS